MNFIESITTCFKKYVEFKGSASRSEHNYFVLFTSILGLIAVAIDGGPDGVANAVVSLSTLLPSLSVSIRRLHDIGKSGWWLLLVFTIIGIFPVIYWTCFKKGEL
tara:strand:+ start:2391 stop:2705 length:315 start_codon:yes stop_codon:yes gene_type:complete